MKPKIGQKVWLASEGLITNHGLIALEATVTDIYSDGHLCEVTALDTLEFGGAWSRGMVFAAEAQAREAGESIRRELIQSAVDVAAAKVRNLNAAE